MALNATPGDPDAESYLTVAEVKARWDAVGYDYSGIAPDPDAFEQALRRATEWIEGRYGDRFPGTPTDADQALHFPATAASDVYGRVLTGIPSAVKRAVAEAAYREAVVPNSLTPDFVRATTLKRRKVEGIEREWFEPRDADDVTPLLTVVENLLSRILKPDLEGVVPVGVYSIGPKL